MMDAGFRVSEAPIVTVTVAPDGLSAAAVAPRGAPIPREFLLDAFRRAGVTFGVDPAAVALLASGAHAGEVTFARGVAAVDGEDSRVEHLTAELAGAGFTAVEDQTGTVDLRGGHVAQHVTPGQVLAKKHPATPGTPGRKVTGEPIAPRVGKDIAALVAGNGAGLSPDRLSIVAKVGGLPKLVGAALTVCSACEVKNVDFHTGDIHFVGSVTVDGDVLHGFTVEATEDIVVRGHVDGGKLREGSLAPEQSLVRSPDSHAGAERLDILADGDDLAGQRPIGHRPAGLGGVLEDAPPGRLGLCQRAVDGDRGVQQKAPVVLIQGGADGVVDLLRATVHAGPQNPQHAQGVPKALVHHVDGAQQIGHTLEGEDAHVAGDEHLIGGHQGVQRQIAQVGRTVDEDGVEVGARGLQGALQDVLATHAGRETGVRLVERLVGRCHGETVDVASHHRVHHVAAAWGQQDVRQAGAGDTNGLAQGARHVPLGIDVDDEHPLGVGQGQRAGEVDGGGRLPDAALLRGHGDHARVSAPRGEGGRRAGTASGTLGSELLESGGEQIPHAGLESPTGSGGSPAPTIAHMACQ